MTTCGKCLCYRARGLHHTYIKVDEFTFTGWFSSSYWNSALSRTTSPLYPLAAPIPQDLKQPDLPFYFFQFCKFGLKDKRKQLTEELKMEMWNLVNQHKELSDVKKS